MVPISLGWLLFYVAIVLLFIGWTIAEFKNRYRLIRLGMGILIYVLAGIVAFQIFDRMCKAGLGRSEATLLKLADASEGGDTNFVRENLARYKRGRLSGARWRIDDFDKEMMLNMKGATNCVSFPTALEMR